MESGLEYVFGIGDGHTTSWVSVPDEDVNGDGHHDAISLDFDGDGRRDDLLWDVDGDGVVDVAALDLDDDGEVDHWFGDDGTGVWGRPVDRSTTGEMGAPPPAGRQQSPADESVAPGVPNAGRNEIGGSESGGGEIAGGEITVNYDIDRDGTPDVELTGTRRAGIPVVGRLYIDENGDGTYDRVLVDTDTDGAADVTFGARSPEFGRP